MCHALEQGASYFVIYVDDILFFSTEFQDARGQRDTAPSYLRRSDQRS